jgi:hypothetical protein
MELHHRLAIFLERLRTAPACRTAKEAFALVCRLIEEVEDEFCPVPPESPPPFHFTGRMYAPQPDFVREIGETLVATTRHHRVWCQPNGAIRIVHVPRKELVLEKRGATDEHPI